MKCDKLEGSDRMRFHKPEVRKYETAVTTLTVTEYMEYCVLLSLLSIPPPQRQVAILIFCRATHRFKDVSPPSRTLLPSVRSVKWRMWWESGCGTRLGQLGVTH
jgi:hypothetical protein